MPSARRPRAVSPSAERASIRSAAGAAAPSAVDPVAAAVEHLASALSEAGLAPLPSRVWAALLSDPDGRMTAAELSGSLQVSAAGVSGAVNYLAQVGFIRREREPGSRRDVYVAMEDVWHAMLLRSDQTYAPIIRALDEGVAAAIDDQARERLEESREFLGFVAEEMARMAKRWEARKAARRV